MRGVLRLRFLKNSHSFRSFSIWPSNSATSFSFFSISSLFNSEDSSKACMRLSIFSIICQTEMKIRNKWVTFFWSIIISHDLHAELRSSTNPGTSFIQSFEGIFSNLVKLRIGFFAKL